MKLSQSLDYEFPSIKVNVFNGGVGVFTHCSVFFLVYILHCLQAYIKKHMLKTYGGDAGPDLLWVLISFIV